MSDVYCWFLVRLGLVLGFFFFFSLICLCGIVGLVCFAFGLGLLVLVGWSFAFGVFVRMC